MTTITAPTTSLGALPVEVGPVTHGNVVRSEWIKFRTVRSTVVVSALTGLFMVGLALLVSSSIRVAAPWDRAVVLRLGRFRALRGPGNDCRSLPQIASAIDRRHDHRDTAVALLATIEEAQHRLDDPS